MPGVLIEKLSKVNANRTETVFFWPYVGKAKMCLGGKFFENCKQIAEILNKFSKIAKK